MATARFACISLSVALVLGVACAVDHVTEIEWDRGVMPLGEANTAHVEGGDILKFVTTDGLTHDVMLLTGETHYDTCDFTGATPLKNESTTGYPFDFTVPDGGYTDNVTWHYIACSVSGGGHCNSGQKLKVMVHAPGTLRTDDGHSDSDGHSHGDDGNTTSAPTATTSAPTSSAPTTSAPTSAPTAHEHEEGDGHDHGDSGNTTSPTPAGNTTSPAGNAASQVPVFGAMGVVLAGLASALVML